MDESLSTSNPVNMELGSEDDNAAPVSDRSKWETREEMRQPEASQRERAHPNAHESNIDLCANKDRRSDSLDAGQRGDDDEKNDTAMTSIIFLNPMLQTEKDHAEDSGKTRSTFDKLCDVRNMTGEDTVTTATASVDKNGEVTGIEKHRHNSEMANPEHGDISQDQIIYGSPKSASTVPKPEKTRPKVTGSLDVLVNEFEDLSGFNHDLRQAACTDFFLQTQLLREAPPNVPEMVCGWETDDSISG